MSWVYNHSEQVQHLRELHTLLINTGCIEKLQLSFGTFLGANRQGALNTKYTSTWDDLDFAFMDKDKEIIIDTLFPEIEKLGWRSDMVWWNPDDELSQITFIKGSDRLDINQVFNYPTHQHMYVHWIQAGPQLLKKGLRSEYYLNIKDYNVDGVDFYGPEEGNKYCVDMYGDNWRVPCTSETEYDYTSDSPGLPWWDRVNI